MARITAILDATEGGAVAREARGLSIVLLYAAYERLLRGLARAILEAALGLRAGNRRLRPRLQVFAVLGRLRAVSQTSYGQMWDGRGLDVVEALNLRRTCTVSTDAFPNDGTHMRREQIMSFCGAFGLADPAPVLREAWDRIDNIVAQRNAIAHGERTPDEVGRSYTIDDIRELVLVWEARWFDFLAWVERQADSRAFFLMPR